MFGVAKGGAGMTIPILPGGLGRMNGSDLGNAFGKAIVVFVAIVAAIAGGLGLLIGWWLL